MIFGMRAAITQVNNNYIYNFKYSTYICIFKQEEQKKIILQLFVDFAYLKMVYTNHMNLSEKLKKMRTKNKLSMSQVARLSQKATDHGAGSRRGISHALNPGRRPTPACRRS